MRCAVVATCTYVSGCWWCVGVLCSTSVVELDSHVLSASLLVLLHMLLVLLSQLHTVNVYDVL